jgi:hypothetical protein
MMDHGQSVAEMPRLGRAGLVPDAPARIESLPRETRNPILEWLRRKSLSARAYLDQLSRMDEALAESLKETYSLAQVRRRLALTLFIDFAREQGLCADEVATLLGDAQTAANDAMNYLILAARHEDAPAAA